LLWQAGAVLVGGHVLWRLAHQRCVGQRVLRQGVHLLAAGPWVWQRGGGHMTWKWRNFQSEVIEQVIEGGGKALIALPLGAGKTAVSDESLSRFGSSRIMVIA